MEENGPLPSRVSSRDRLNASSTRCLYSKNVSTECVIGTQIKPYLVGEWVKHTHSPYPPVFSIPVLLRFCRVGCVAEACRRVAGHGVSRIEMHTTRREGIYPPRHIGGSCIEHKGSFQGWAHGGGPRGGGSGIY